MAVTVTSVVSTPGKLIYELADDGVGGSLTLTNTDAGAGGDLDSDSAGQNADTPIRKLINMNLADQAAARSAGLQGNPEDGAQGAIARITSRGGVEGATQAWGVDATQATNRLNYIVTGPGAAETAYLVIEALHSFTR